jgi:hypothetical protein
VVTISSRDPGMVLSTIGLLSTPVYTIRSYSYGIQASIVTHIFIVNASCTQGERQNEDDPKAISFPQDYTRRP